MTRFVLVTRAAPIVSTLHVEHPWEQCNTDDAVKSEQVDEETAAALMATGMARACEFCEPAPNSQTLNTRSDAP